MKTVKTKKTLLVLFVAFWLFLACALGWQMSNKNLSVNADSVNVANKTDFWVEDGASVRTAVGSSGIRFTTKISTGFYNTATATGAEWHTIIG